VYNAKLDAFDVGALLSAIDFRLEAIRSQLAEYTQKYPHWTVDNGATTRADWEDEVKRLSKLRDYFFVLSGMAMPPEEEN
jgi:L-rhamnose isomerase